MPRNMQVYILARNEEDNIAACLQALQRPGLQVTVLDSGSTDGTLAAVSRFSGVHVEPYAYTSHCEAYNWITAKKGASPYVMVLDADMKISDALMNEITNLIDAAAPQVIQAPVTMCVDGVPLKHGSLYPPKPIVFKAGAAYFTADGHGERLLPELDVQTCRKCLVHDDRKPYEAFLESQCRYSRNFIGRETSGRLDWQDRLRAGTWLMMWIVPLYSWIICRGFLSGRAGRAYALDRLIAEAIRCRFILSRKLHAKSSKEA